MRLDWQTENPLEEWHLDERERLRETEALRAEIEVDHYMEKTNAFKTVESKAGLEKRLEAGGRIIQGSGAATERNYPGVSF